jgi:hypothetical protein
MAELYKEGSHAAPPEYKTGSKIQQCQDLKWSDVDSSDNKIKDCASHAIWARDQGLATHPDYYKPYSNLHSASSFGDFQCMLYYKTQEEDVLKSKLNWECPYPCTEPKLEFEGGWPACPDSLLDDTGELDVEDLDEYIRKGAAKVPETADREMVTIIHQAGAAMIGSPEGNAKVVAPDSKEGIEALPWWGWTFGVVALLAIIGVVVAYFCGAHLRRLLSGKAPTTRGLKKDKLQLQTSPKVAAAEPSYAQVPAVAPGSMYTATAPVTATPVYVGGGSVSYAAGGAGSTTNAAPFVGALYAGSGYVPVQSVQEP